MNTTLAQDLSLKITSLKKSEQSVIEKIEYQKKHNDSVSIINEVNRISNYLKNIGYFTNTIDSIKKEKSNYSVYISLKNKITQAILNTSHITDLTLSNIEIIDKKISISINELETSLSNISMNLEKQGKSFSKVRLKDVVIKKNILYADLNIYQSKKRIINKIIIKGYEDFPKSYLKNYFNIKPNTVFNQKKIKQISDYSKNLDFIEEIKSPEVLFTKDSTLIYMYLKKLQNNSFDGIVNFASKEDGGVLFNGNLDLKLNNILNTGEKFELFWNRIGNEREEFTLSSETPYIFNSKFTPFVSLSIYKQDSTFLNTKFDSKLSYNINSKIKIAATYNSESSDNLEESINNNVATFNNNFFGLQFSYNIPKNDYFFNNKFSLEINPTFGTRKHNNTNTNQFKIEASTSYIWDINRRNSFFVKNVSGHLNSTTYLDNEIFRIGGSNSLRGFNEQSIFTNSYSYFNLELRHLNSNTSYFYSITDYGILKDNKLLGLGLGYRFKKNNSIFNLNTVIGNSLNDSFKLKNPQLNVNWKTFF